MRKNILRRGVQLLLVAGLGLAALTAAETADRTEEPVQAAAVSMRTKSPFLESGLRLSEGVMRAFGLLPEPDQPAEDPPDRLAEPPAEQPVPEKPVSPPEEPASGWLALPNARTDRLGRYDACAAGHPELSAEAVVLSVNMDRDRAFYSHIYEAADPDSLAVLVNKYSALPSDYAPQLEALGANYGSGSLRPEAAKAFRAMADGAKADGVSLRSVSAYRSYETQKNLYSRYLKRYKNKQSTVDTFSARAGHSEHQTGLALDINVASVRAKFENTPAFAWLKAHCAEYGFILRYDQGKEDVTGYRFEPWHYRYVGVEAAQACMSQGLAYEEYLALLPR